MIYYPDQKVYLGADIPVMARYWRNSRGIFKWCRQYTLRSEEEQSQWLKSIQGNETVKMFSIKDVGGQNDVGVCGLTSIDKQNQKAEFSLYIAQEYQRRGYAKSALYTLLRHGFFDMNLNRIWGETFEGNPAIKLFHKLGMITEGTMRETYYKEGNWLDSHIVSILRKDFVI